MSTNAQVIASARIFQLRQPESGATTNAAATVSPLRYPDAAGEEAERGHIRTAVMCPLPASPRGRRAMTRKYEIHSGRRTVSIQYSVSALQAVVDYLRSFGCSDDEIRRLGVDSVSWRGARFSAVLAPADGPAE